MSWPVRYYMYLKAVTQAVPSSVLGHKTLTAYLTIPC